MPAHCILHIETSEDICSVSLGREGKYLDQVLDDTPRSHARVLTVLIETLFRRNNIDTNELQGVAVSGGPGSYTGLRIGVSAAKGMVWGLEIPLISVPTTEAMVCGIMEKKDQLPGAVSNNPDALFCPVIDARRMEVYSAVYNSKGKVTGAVEAKIITEDSFRKTLDIHPVLFFGSGAGKCSEVIRHPNAFFEKEFYPLAKHLIPGAWKRFQLGLFEDTAYYEPFYLKNFIPTIPGNRLV